MNSHNLNIQNPFGFIDYANIKEENNESSFILSPSNSTNFMMNKSIIYLPEVTATSSADYIDPYYLSEQTELDNYLTPVFTFPYTEVDAPMPYDEYQVLSESVSPICVSCTPSSNRLHNYVNPGVGHLYNSILPCTSHGRLSVCSSVDESVRPYSNVKYKSSDHMVSKDDSSVLCKTACFVAALLIVIGIIAPLLYITLSETLYSCIHHQRCSSTSTLGTISDIASYPVQR